ncbi:MAG: hypothetical protein AB1545_15640 [Thermodesulfobacteriota bacterium]
MDSKTWKIVAATCTVIGLFLGFLELYFRPSVLLLENSKTYPDWAKWFRLVMTSVAPIAYIILDVFEHKKSKKNKQISDNQ